MSATTAVSVAEGRPAEMVGLFTYVMSYDNLVDARTHVVAALSASGDRVSFGRELGATRDATAVELPDPHASRAHAIAHRQGSTDWIENKSSKGTFLNGAP